MIRELPFQLSTRITTSLANTLTIPSERENHGIRNQDTITFAGESETWLVSVLHS